jgi:alkylation response protein AidB-like acyl-CoA dehydrogenase
MDSAMSQPIESGRTGDHGTNSSPLLSDKARQMIPFFSEQSVRNEAKGQLTGETLAGLRDAGFFSLWIPSCFGGAEAWPLEAIKVIETLSYADGATGWVFMAVQVAMGSAAAYLPPAAARAIFAKHTPVIAGHGMAHGRAEIDGDGFRLTGNWQYASGLLHAEFIHTGGVVYENGAPRTLPGSKSPDARIFILPVSEAKFLGNWDVIGLRATGSIDYSLTDVFVPEEFTHEQLTNVPRQGGNFYTLGIQGMGAIGHSSFALGVGRRILDELGSLARAESGRPGTLPQIGGGESFQEQFGAAEAKFRAVRALAHETWGDIEETLRRGDALTTRQMTLARLTLNYITSVTAEVCTFAYKYAGGRGLRAGTIQRCFRDMYAGTQHVFVGPSLLRECGKELLGAEPKKVWGPRGLVDPS